MRKWLILVLLPLLYQIVAATSSTLRQHSWPSSLLGTLALSYWTPHIVVARHKEPTQESAGAMFAQRLNTMTGQLEWVVVDVDAAAGISDGSGTNNSEEGGKHDGKDGDVSSGANTAGLLQGTTYVDMLNDEARNEAYGRAISQAVQPGDLVLDIGTGTGLLAMMAARAMQDKQQQAQAQGQQAQEEGMHWKQQQQQQTQHQHTCTAGPEGDGSNGAAASDGGGQAVAGRVVACEVYPPTARLAQRVVRMNGLQHVVEVHGKRSDDLTVGFDGEGPLQHNHQQQQQAELPRRADMVVSEVLDSELLGEGVLPVMRFALQQLLKPGAVVLPSSATVYAQLIDCKELGRRTDVRPALQQLTLLPSAVLGSNTTRGSAGSATEPLSPPQQQQQGEEQQQQQEEQQPSRCQPMDVNPLHQLGLLRPLSEPVPILDFDFSHPPPAEGRSREVAVRATASGVATALVVWWDLSLDPASAITISTRPGWVAPPPAGGRSGVADGGQGGKRQQWREHWRQCWYGVAPAICIEQGQQVTLQVTHDDYSISVQAKQQQQQQQQQGSHGSGGLAQSSEDGAQHSAGQGRSAAAVARLKALIPALYSPNVIAALGDASLAQSVRAAVQQVVDKSVAAASTDTTAATAAVGATANEGGRSSSAGRNAVAAAEKVAVEVVVAGDFPLVPLAAASQSGVVRVHVLQPLAAAWEAILLAADASSAVGKGCHPTGNGSGGGGDGSGSDTASFETTGKLSRLLLGAQGIKGAAAAAAAADDDDGGGGAVDANEQDGQCFAGAEAAGEENGASAGGGANLCISSLGPPGGTRPTGGGGGKVGGATVFAAFPYYRDAEALPPWAHLRFWAERDQALASGVLSPRHWVSPRSATLWGVCAALPDLWRANRSLGVVQGFDLSAANRLLLGSDPRDRHQNGSVQGEGGARESAVVDVGGRMLPRAVWQCGGGYMEASCRFPLLRFDFEGALASLEASAEVSFTEEEALPSSPLANGTALCHAVVLWLEYDLDGTGENLLSTGPPPPSMREGARQQAHSSHHGHQQAPPPPPGYWRQGVFLLDRPIVHQHKQHEKHLPRLGRTTTSGGGGGSSGQGAQQAGEAEGGKEQQGVGGGRQGWETPLVVKGLSVAASFRREDGEVDVQVRARVM